MDTENTVKRIRKELENTRAYSSPEDVEMVKKLIKKNVPLTMRLNFAAYILIDLMKDDQKKKEKNGRRNRRPELDNAKTFYINVGKFSKTTGKELAQFIVNETSLQPEDLVSLIFKQNYSFFSVKEDKEAGIIQALSGKTYQGKKIKVNYGKTKAPQEE